MDRMQTVNAGRIRLATTTTTTTATSTTTATRPDEPRRFDFGEWYFRWFGAGVLEEWLGSTNWAATLWAQRMLDATLTHGS